MTDKVKVPDAPIVGEVGGTTKGSAARFNHGKPDYSLIPLCTLEDEAKVWAMGREKYGEWNWARGMKWSVPFACMLRHMAAWQAGQDIDEESGISHIAHIMCNARMLALYEKTFPEGDDRPTKWLEDFKKVAP